jgi:hypothetical protein
MGGSRGIYGREQGHSYPLNHARSDWALAPDFLFQADEDPGLKAKHPAALFRGINAPAPSDPRSLRKEALSLFRSSHLAAR